MRASSRIVASCSPCDAAMTASRSGHFGAFMPPRNSVSSAPGKSTRNSRIGLPLAAPSACALPKISAHAEVARPGAPAVAVVARTLRRVGDENSSHMLALLGGKDRAHVERVCEQRNSAFGTVRSYQRMKSNVPQLSNRRRGTTRHTGRNRIGEGWVRVARAPAASSWLPSASHVDRERRDQLRSGAVTVSAMRPRISGPRKTARAR